MNTFNLSLHTEPLHHEVDGVAHLHKRRLVVRDDLGRELAVSFMAWGPVATLLASSFRGLVAVDGELPDSTEAIVMSERLDAGADYLLIAVPIAGAIEG
jgi:hypothetical protein